MSDKNAPQGAEATEAASDTPKPQNGETSAPTKRKPRVYEKFDAHLVQYVRNQHPDAPDQEIFRFLHLALKSGLDPISNQIYLVKRRVSGQDVWQVQTGIDGLRFAAHRTGRYGGSDDAFFNDCLTHYQAAEAEIKRPTSATVTVHAIVEGIKVSATATALWGEYVPKGNQAFMWNSMPFLMLSKVAESLALRKMFPEDLSGLYSDAEMMQADTPPQAIEGPSEATRIFDNQISIPDPTQTEDNNAADVS